MDLVRAWKDPEYRAQLDTAPSHPSGDGLHRIEESGLADVAGAGTERASTLGCCNVFYTFTTVVTAYCVVTVTICS